MKGKTMKHERFTYKNPDEIKAKAKELKVHLPFAENTEALRKQGRFGNVTLSLTGILTGIFIIADKLLRKFRRFGKTFCQSTDTF